MHDEVASATGTPEVEGGIALTCRTRNILKEAHEVDVRMRSKTKEESWTHQIAIVSIRLRPLLQDSSHVKTRA